MKAFAHRVLPFLLLLALAGCATPPPAPSPETGAAAAPATSVPTEAVADHDVLTVCSFNIQWLGQSTRRDNAALADLLSPYDIVVVQELIAAPATSPNDPGSRQRAAAFFAEMGRRGFAFHLSGSDIGGDGASEGTLGGILAASRRIRSMYAGSLET